MPNNFMRSPSVFLQIGTGTRMKALATQGGKSMRDNIANVFGPRAVEALTPMDASLGGIAKATGCVHSAHAVDRMFQST